jgi:hypothetical protein
MSADHALQLAIRARLVATAAVTALVPAGSILDRNARPAPNPAIIIGEAQSVDEGRIDRKAQRIYATLHIWKKEPGLAGVKQIAGAVRAAIHEKAIPAENSFFFGDCFVSGMRFLRDPDGETAHAVVTVEAVVSEA